MKRLDARLVELGLAPSRTKAQRLIETGEVEIQILQQKWKVVDQPSFDSSKLTAEQIRINASAALLKYVSRGGLKLEAALLKLGLDVKDWRALDIGISTGGFTHCLLKQGCAEVVGLDVGHGQLAELLQKDKRVHLVEGVNVREIHELPHLRDLLKRGFDICVVDVSFISLQLVIPPLAQVLRPGTRLLTLVKPQFELGAAALDKAGVVRDAQLQDKALQQVQSVLSAHGFVVGQSFSCEVKGQDGNQEYFIESRRS